MNRVAKTVGSWRIWISLSRTYVPSGHLFDFVRDSFGMRAQKLKA